MGNVLVNDVYLYGIADALREKHDTEKKYLPSEMEDAVRGIQSGSGVDLLEYSVYIMDSFSGMDFGSQTDIHIKLGTKVDANYKTNSLRQAFANTKGVKNIKITTKESSVTVNLQNLFYNSADLEVVDLTDFKLKASSITQLFHSCRKLREVKGVLDLTSNTSSSMPLYNCLALEDITIKEGTIHEGLNLMLSPLLNEKSRQSVIDGLADLTGGTSQNIIWHKTFDTVITDEQKAQITSKNWTMAFG